MRRPASASACCVTHVHACIPCGSTLFTYIVTNLVVIQHVATGVQQRMVLSSSARCCWKLSMLIIPSLLYLSLGPSWATASCGCCPGCGCAPEVTQRVWQHRMPPYIGDGNIHARMDAAGGKVQQVDASKPVSLWVIEPATPAAAAVTMHCVHNVPVNGVSGCFSCAVGLCACENSDGRLVAWASCGCVLIRSSTLWLLPFTPCRVVCNCLTSTRCTVTVSAPPSRLPGAAATHTVQHAWHRCCRDGRGCPVADAAGQVQHVPSRP